jgi:hypothetical protein
MSLRLPHSDTYDKLNITNVGWLLVTGYLRSVLEIIGLRKFGGETQG